MNEFMTIEELTEFAKKIFDESGKTIKETTEALGFSRQTLHSCLTKSTTNLNGPRKKLFAYLGYEIGETKYEVRKK